MSYQRAPLKWAGGKYGLLDDILSALPAGERLIEPFAGSAVVSLNVDTPRVWVNDRNADLIALYRYVKRDCEGFIRRTRRLFGPQGNTREHYLARRAEFNACEDPSRRAVLFYYLLSHGYNGLSRFNARGEWNVPFGRHTDPRVKTEALRALSTRLHRARITDWDFRRVMRQAQPGDVVYLDPPYDSDSNGFTCYTGTRFTRADHGDLVALAEDLQQRGVPVVLSNHATALAQELCQGAQVQHLQVRRNISCNGQRRRRAAEILATYIPL